jgi:hypothetical protein
MCLEAGYVRPMRKLITALVAVAVGLTLAGCGSSSSGGGNKPSNVANSAAGKQVATTQIKANYRTFFDVTTPRPTAVGLLENGDKLGAAIALAAKVAKVEKTKETAVVTKVTFSDPTHADVIYDLKGTPLTGSNGKAVLVNGTWKVAQSTFCTLADLGAQTINKPSPPNC